MKKRMLLSVFLIVGFSQCDKENITLSVHANDTFYVENEGATMKVCVRGNTLSKTFMLIVHGGPGGTASQYPVPPYVSNNCAIAYWDQRVAGSSQGANLSATINIDTYIKDLKKVILTIKHRYGQDIGIFLFGHSWGGFLSAAFLTFEKNQAMVKGWIYCEGVHNFPLLNRLVRDKLVVTGNAEITANTNVSTWQPIVDYCHSLPPGNVTPEQSLKLNEYAAVAENILLKGVTLKAQKYSHESPSVAFLSNYLNTSNPLNTALFKKLNNAELSSKLYTVIVPVLVVSAKFDFTTPSGLGDDVISTIGSGIKKHLVLTNSGHDVHEWDKCMQEVLKFINDNK